MPLRPTAQGPSRYLGDSVYVVTESSGMFVLTTNNGYGPSNTIALEPEVFEALLDYAVNEAKFEGSRWLKQVPAS